MDSRELSFLVSSQSSAPPAKADQYEGIEQLYIGLEGVLVRLRLGNVLLEEQEHRR